MQMFLQIQVAFLMQSFGEKIVYNQMISYYN